MRISDRVKAGLQMYHKGFTGLKETIRKLFKAIKISYNIHSNCGMAMASFPPGGSHPGAGTLRGPSSGTLLCVNGPGRPAQAVARLSPFRLAVRTLSSFTWSVVIVSAGLGRRPSTLPASRVVGAGPGCDELDEAGRGRAQARGPSKGPAGARAFLSCGCSS